MQTNSNKVKNIKTRKPLPWEALKAVQAKRKPAQWERIQMEYENV